MGGVTHNKLPMAIMHSTRKERSLIHRCYMPRTTMRYYKLSLCSEYLLMALYRTSRAPHRQLRLLTRPFIILVRIKLLVREIYTLSFLHPCPEPYSGQYQMQLPPVAAPAAQRTATTTPATFPAPAFGVDVSLLLQEPNALGSGSADVQRAPSQVVDVTPNIADGQTPATGNAPVPQGPSVDGATPTSPEKPPVDGAAGGKGDDSDEEYEEDAAGNIVKRTDIKGRHVSTLNNLHGWVDGVGRGLDGWGMSFMRGRVGTALMNHFSRCGSDRQDGPRLQRATRCNPSAQRNDAHRHFKGGWLVSVVHEVHSGLLRAQAEHLSTRTGSWLYIAAQHPASTAGFIHYASVKLRQNEAELAKLHEQAGRCMGALMDGSRKEVTKLSAEVREKDAEIKALEKKLLAAEASLAVKESDISMLGRAIALVRAGDPQALALLAQYSGEPSEEPSNTPLINV